MVICKGETKLRSAAANREPGMHVYTKLRMFKILDTILLLVYYKVYKEDNFYLASRVTLNQCLANLCFYYFLSPWKENCKIYCFPLLRFNLTS
jgi:hypothetical protein